jgi:signal transduction histidine kinase
LPAALAPPAAAGYRTLAMPGGPWREAVELRSVAGDSAPRWVRALRSEAPLRAELAALALKVGVGALAAAALCAVLAAAWVGRVLAPLRALTVRMQHVNAQPGIEVEPESHRLQPTSRTSDQHAASEVEALADEFDAMLARLAASHRNLERFAADCAHALRTPLTALRLRGERQGQALAEGLARAAVAGMLEEADRMSVLIQRLLLLARAHDDAVVSPQELDLGELLVEVFDTLAPLVEQRDMALVAEPAAGGTVLARADAGWLQQVLQDLVHNALEHAGGPNHAVRGSVRVEHGLAVVELVDQGAGVPADVLARLGLPAWDRAARETGSMAQPAASRASGTGLGLAIAARLLAVQGGRLELLPADRDGTRARCVLPGSTV